MRVKILMLGLGLMALAFTDAVSTNATEAAAQESAAAITGAAVKRDAPSVDEGVDEFCRAYPDYCS